MTKPRKPVRRDLGAANAAPATTKAKETAPAKGKGAANAAPINEGDAAAKAASKAAEATLGERLKEMPKASGGQPYRSTGTKSEPVESRPPTLAQLGGGKSAARPPRRSRRRSSAACARSSTPCWRRTRAATMPDPSPIEALMQVCAGEIDDAARATICECVTAYREGHVGSLDEAFRLQARPGQRRPGTLLRLACRDKAIRELAARAFPGLKRAKQARLIAQALARYEGTIWRRTRGNSDNPHPDDLVRSLLWKTLKTGPAPSFSTIRRLLTSSGYS